MEKYEKIRVVGRGAYGTVHLCIRLSDKKQVIIKQIPVEQMTKDERQAALNEVKVLSMLHHPNIIQYYENFLEDKALMIVMEYAQGGTLLDFLQSRNGCLLEEEDILKFLAQMLMSLQHVHSKQILHRDLKTQNILLDKKKEVVKIGDFGISKVLSSKSKAYTNLPALILKIMRGTFSPISSQYSPQLRELILAMLHLDPARRPTINQIMAQPLLINTIMNLHTDAGKLPCVRINRPLSSMQSTGRGRVSSRGNSTARDGMPVQPQPLSSVFWWGGGTALPTKLPLPNPETQVVQVSAGRTQKAAVTRNGRLFVWESQAVGAETLMPGATEGSSPTLVPRYLEGQAAVTIQHVACGDLFTACLTDRGILMTFGSGVNGCLGHGNCNDVVQAKIVEALLGYEVVQVSCGASHVLAVTNEHEVFAWGRGDNGRLGLGNYASCTSPQPVAVPDNCRPCSVHCGMDCSVILTLEKSLLCSGSNRYNKLALDKPRGEIQDGVERMAVLEEAVVFSPVASAPINSLPIKMVSLGTSHSAIVTEAGECYTAGSNQFGQLGAVADSGSRGGPVLVSALSGKAVSLLACGDIFTVAVTEDQVIYTWGKTSRGRLGRSDRDSHLPGAVGLPKGDSPMTIVSVSSSHGSTLVAATRE
ncbi:hypothetical protein EGW08_007105 [Elysia chlorotica]|uniref:non-specific serine/threonine protein kinase n=1 Tax=Elysia chlorotica TaxID=188477 RepID=A0A433TUA5_ELYCH|nr:hypothetical protein EGW08_007105 [Elysia chlorotica]